jgi:hypothetical protein
MPMMMQDFYKAEQASADVDNTRQNTLASQANTAKTIQDTGIEKEQWDLQKAYRESMSKAPTQALADISKGYAGQIATFTASAQRNATLAKIALQYGQTKDAEDYEKNARDDASQAQSIQAEEKQRVAASLAGVKTQEDLSAAIDSLRNQGVDVDSVLQAHPFMSNINDPRTKSAISALVKEGLTAEQVQAGIEKQQEFEQREQDRKDKLAQQEKDNALKRQAIAAARANTYALQKENLDLKIQGVKQKEEDKTTHDKERQQDLVTKQVESISTALQRNLDRINNNVVQGVIDKEKGPDLTKQAEDAYVTKLKATLSAAQKRGVDLSSFEDPMGLVVLKRR